MQVTLLTAFAASQGLVFKADHTALHQAAKYDFPSLAKFLVMAGADINARDVFGQTPLHVAVKNYNEHIMWVLVQAGADLDAHDEKGDTPLTLAIHAGRTEAASYLIKHGAHVGLSDLHLAVKEGMHEIVMLLLNCCHTTATAVDDDGNTCLHIAASHHAYRIAMALIRHAPSMCDTYNSEGKLPLHAAVESGDIEMVKLMMSAYYAACIDRVILNDPDVLTALLRRHEASSSEQMLKVLWGPFPLHKAAFYGLIGLAKYMVWGIRMDVNALNENSESVLVSAVKGFQLGTIVWLELHACDRTYYGSYAVKKLLDSAICKNNVEMLDWLLCRVLKDAWPISVDELIGLLQHTHEDQFEIGLRLAATICRLGGKDALKKCRLSRHSLDLLDALFGDAADSQAPAAKKARLQ